MNMFSWDKLSLKFNLSLVVFLKVQSLANYNFLYTHVWIYESDVKELRPAWAFVSRQRLSQRYKNYKEYRSFFLLVYRRFIALLSLFVFPFCMAWRLLLGVGKLKYSDCSFVPHSCYVDQFAFHISLHKSKSKMIEGNIIRKVKLCW